MESEILPRYFNHSSFASLRRQLNYFSFSRIGKDNQHAATYYNDQVIQLSDILTLRRRSVGTSQEHLKKHVVPPFDLLPSSNLGRRNPAGKSVAHILHNKESVSKDSSKNKKKRISKCLMNSSIPVIHVIHRRSKESTIPVEDSADSHHRHELNIKNIQSSSTRKMDLKHMVDHMPLTSSPLAPATVLHSVSNNSLVLTEMNDRSPDRRCEAKDVDVLDGCKALLALGS